MQNHRSCWTNAVFGLGLLVAAGAAAEPVATATDGVAVLARVPAETMKADMALGAGLAWPRTSAVAGAPLQVRSCAPEIVAQPLAIGTKEGFSAAGLIQGLGKSALNTGLSLLSGGMISAGGRGGRDEPDLQRDVVKRKWKSKVAHPEKHTKLRVGAVMDEDAMTMSVYLDKAKGKGTVHAMYLETEDCRRFWPDAYLAYSLWGQWNLSVSWTRTSETYQDGQLVDRSSASGGWSTGWQRLPGGIQEVASLTDPAALEALSEYQVGLLEELGAPAWRRTGFSAPLSGPRATGALFQPEAALLSALDAGQLRAVVHVTRDLDGVFQTVAMPMRMQPEEDRIAFSLLEEAFSAAP